MEDVAGLVMQIEGDFKNTPIDEREFKKKIVRALSAFLNATYEADLQYIRYYPIQLSNRLSALTNSIVLKLRQKNSNKYGTVRHSWGLTQWKEFLNLLYPFLEREGIHPITTVWNEENTLETSVLLSLDCFEHSQ